MSKLRVKFVWLLVIGMVLPVYAELIDRGGGLIYDTELNVIWLQRPISKIGSG